MAAAVREVLGFEADPAVATSQNPQFGDYQSNAALQVAGRLTKQAGEKSNPRQIAQRLITAFDAADLLAEPPQIAGPGFINFRLSPAYTAAAATQALADERLGVSPSGQPQRVVVEYSSPNIAKQMHVGHIRSTILGDAAARVLEFLGHQVIRQNHVGDWGTQFGMLIANLRAAARGREDFHISDLERFYQQAKKRFDEDPAFADASRKAVVQLQAGDPETRAAWRKLVEETRRHYLPLYERLGVSLRVEHERGESFYNPRLPSLTQDLLAAGVAEESEGAIVSFAGGFKAPLMIRKSDGGFGYGTTDLAAVEFRARSDRIEAYGLDGLGVDRAVYFVDARQSQHFKQVFATAQAAAERIDHWRRAAEVSFEHASFGTVLGEDGTPIKTREGESVKLADLLDEAQRRALAVVRQKNPGLSDAEAAELARAVGIGAVKYADLSKDRTSDYIFSFDQMLSLDGNTAPYLQYAYCRICSIREKAGAADTSAGEISTLKAPQELALAKHLLAFGDTARAVAHDLKPHVLCSYLYELATLFSGFYENCPVIRSEGETRSSRLALTAFTGRTLATGLDLLGIAHPERM